MRRKDKIFTEYYPEIKKREEEIELFYYFLLVLFLNNLHLIDHTLKVHINTFIKINSFIN